MLDQIVAQARAEAPNECCGIIGARDGSAVTVFPVRNAAASPLRYEMDPKDQLRVFEALDDADLDVGAIYHSHTRSDPLPSQTDINLAFYPDALYLILGVKDADRDDVRAWRIVDGKVSETALEVGEG
jgi:[CysO sulfur-carrier protein]-S-L-cysteine hydrolase